MRGSDFQFRFAGFQLTKTLLDEIDFGVVESFGRDEEAVSNVYQLIEPDALQFIYQVNYNHRMSNVVGEFPACRSSLSSSRFVLKVQSKTRNTFAGSQSH